MTASNLVPAMHLHPSCCLQAHEFFASEQEGRRSADRRHPTKLRTIGCGGGPFLSPPPLAGRLGGGAPAFRRSTAALARPVATSIGSAPDPRFLRPGSFGCYPLSPVSSLPSTSETGRSAGRSGTQSRPGAVCETARGHRTRSTFRIASRKRPSTSECPLYIKAVTLCQWKRDNYLLVMTGLVRSSRRSWRDRANAIEIAGSSPATTKVFVCQHPTDLRCPRSVRFAPNNCRGSRSSWCPLWAMCGRLRVGKENLHVAGLVGAAMCSAFACGSHDRWP